MYCNYKTKIKGMYPKVQYTTQTTYRGILLWITINRTLRDFYMKSVTVLIMTTLIK